MTTTHHPTGRTIVCPPWCTDHLDDAEEGLRAHRGPDVSFGAPSAGCSEVVQVQLEETAEGGVQVNVDDADLSIGETRRLAAHLLNLADVAESTETGR